MATLARLGDPRVEVLDPDEMQFCLVPKGELWLGRGDEDEMADGRLEKTGLTGIAVSKDALVANEQPHRRYPWGPDPDPNRANYPDTGIGATSAVGIFPGGVSPYGCEEMSGNCWEWTRSLWAPYPYPEPAELCVKREALDAPRDERRALRGDGFSSNAWGIRCAYRYGYFPDPHSRHIGFRVVVRPLL